MWLGAVLLRNSPCFLLETAILTHERAKREGLYTCHNVRSRTMIQSWHILNSVFLYQRICSLFKHSMIVPLSKLAHARSGDKGDAANCGVIAYKEEWYPIIRDILTVERVQRHFEGIALGDVERYELPNLWAVNFVLHNTLGGGGTVSLKLDAQGKTIASAMLMMNVEVPDSLFE